MEKDMVSRKKIIREIELTSLLVLVLMGVLYVFRGYLDSFYGQGQWSPLTFVVVTLPYLMMFQRLKGWPQGGVVFGSGIVLITFYSRSMNLALTGLTICILVAIWEVYLIRRQVKEEFSDHDGGEME